MKLFIYFMAKINDFFFSSYSRESNKSSPSLSNDLQSSECSNGALSDKSSILPESSIELGESKEDAKLEFLSQNEQLELLKKSKERSISYREILEKLSRKFNMDLSPKVNSFFFN